MIARRFGRLLVISYAFTNKHRAKCYLCLCDCGMQKIVHGAELRKGSTISCGCYLREIKSIQCKKMNYKHGGADSKLYRVWQAMKARCYDPNNISFKHYGEKGIKVFSGWINDFSAFQVWALANGYKNGLSIDRINNKNNYEPLNCQWLTRSENTAKSNKERILK